MGYGTQYSESYKREVVAKTKNNDKLEAIFKQFAK